MSRVAASSAGCHGVTGCAPSTSSRTRATQSASSYVPRSRGMCGSAGSRAETAASCRCRITERSFCRGLTALTNARRPSAVRTRSAVPGENPLAWEAACTTGLPRMSSTPRRTCGGTSAHRIRTPAAVGMRDMLPACRSPARADYAADRLPRRARGSRRLSSRGDRSVEQVPTADRPRARARAPEQDLRAHGLLGGGRVTRQAAAADGAPGGRAELVEPVIAGRVDRARVVAGLAVRERVPVQVRDPVAGPGRCRGAAGGRGALDAAPEQLAHQAGTVPVVRGLPADDRGARVRAEVAGRGSDAEVALQRDDAGAVVARPEDDVGAAGRGGGGGGPEDGDDRGDDEQQDGEQRTAA